MPGIEVDQGVWWQVFSPLWFIDPDGKFVPDLAREVPTVENGGLSADGLTWKIKLRSDVKWHDGTAVHGRGRQVLAGSDQQPRFPCAQPRRP